MVLKFKKKPITITALLWDGTNIGDILRWLGAHGGKAKYGADGVLYIKTLEDDNISFHVCSVGDWIIRGIKGEFYACKPDIFDSTYDPVED